MRPFLLRWGHTPALARERAAIMLGGDGRLGAYGVLRRAAAAVADLVIPPLCLSCLAPLTSHDALCPHCWSRIDFIREPLCDRLGLPMPFDAGGTMVSAAAIADPPEYDRARAVVHFDGRDARARA
jgi:hypothetical protein